MCRLFIRNKFKTRLNYVLYYCWKFNEILEIYPKKMKAKKKKRVLVLGVHCLVNKWSGKIQLKVIWWSGGGGVSTRWKKGTFVCFPSIFFSYMLRVNNNKSKLTTRVCWRRGKSEIVSAFIWTTLEFFVNTRRHFICLLLENEEIWNIVNFFHTLYSQ